MVDTTITWKIKVDREVCEMVYALENNCDENSEWAYMMSQIMEWARQKLLEVHDSLFFIFEDIYYSNWEDAEHTSVKIEDDQLIITSQAPGVNWTQRIAGDFAKSLKKVLKDFKP